METNITPSRLRYQLVKAGFVAQGTTLNKYCQSIGVLREAAYRACLGLWVGPKATALLDRLWQASQGGEFPAKIADTSAI